MGLFNDNIRMGASAVVVPDDRPRSLRFNSDDDAYLSFTPSSTGNQKVWTWSGWVKRTKLGVYTNLITCDHHDGEHNNGMVQLAISNSDQLYTYFDTDGSNPYGNIHDAKLRDPSAWYHIVWKVDAANTEQSIWLNGVDYQTSSGQNPPNYAYAMNKASHLMTMGASAWDGVTNHSDLYLAEVHYCDGQEYQASDFGETNADTGQWVPKTVSGLTYGTNGFYLNFSDKSGTTATTLGKDSAGSNNWTPNNLSVGTGAASDSFVDAPTNNWCTLNPLDNGGNTLSQGNTYATTSSGFDLIRSTFFLTSGKWYWEVTCTNVGETFVGVSDNLELLTGRGAQTTATSCMVRTTDGDKYINATESSYAGAAITDGETMMFALDMDNGKFWAGKSGTWFNSGDPVAGSNPATSALTKAVSPSASIYDSEAVWFNFGAGKNFAHTPPTGFKTINSSNLPEATIKKASAHFKSKLYSGVGSSTLSVSGIGFEPDMVWLKIRGNTYTHGLFSKLMSTGCSSAYEYVEPQSQSVETDLWGAIRFDSDGWTGMCSSYANLPTFVHDFGANGENFISYNWKVPTASNNTAGSIDSSVRANATAGISMVSWQGDQTDGSTVGHGLGVAPEMIWCKNKTATGNSWSVYHHELFPTHNDGYVFWLDKPNALEDDADIHGDTVTINSTLFSLGDSTMSNGSGNGMIAYCFVGVEGYSKIGTYIGTGAGGDNGFVYMGFKPQWILIKRTTSEEWIITDAIRDPVNPVAKYFLITGSSEATGVAYDFVSNGVKFRGNSQNESGATYMYYAIADQSFKYANPR